MYILLYVVFRSVVLSNPYEITEDQWPIRWIPEIHVYIFHVRYPFFEKKRDIKHIKICFEVFRHWNRHAERVSFQRQLRSRIWWFAEFCNSHCVSHFAALFIGMGTKISIVENFLSYFIFFLYEKYLVISFDRIN